MTGIICTKKSPLSETNLPNANLTMFHAIRAPCHKDDDGEKSVPRWNLYKEMTACRLGRTSMASKRIAVAWGDRIVAKNISAIGIVQYAEYK